MGLQLEWRGGGSEEHGVVAWSENDAFGFRTGDVVVQVDPRYYRPAEVDTLLGDASLAREVLGWSPRTSFPELVQEMVTVDLRLAREESLIDNDRASQ
jgi:GDPmannose 4,6-dehydratase